MRGFSPGAGRRRPRAARRPRRREARRLRPHPPPVPARAARRHDDLSTRAPSASRSTATPAPPTASCTTASCISSSAASPTTTPPRRRRCATCVRTGPPPWQTASTARPSEGSDPWQDRWGIGPCCQGSDPSTWRACAGSRSSSTTACRRWTPRGRSRCSPPRRGWTATPAMRSSSSRGRAGPVTTSSGLQLVPHRTFAGCRGPLDTLIVAGGDGSRAAARDDATVRFVENAARRSRRVASVCTGAFVLAATGMLDGRRATTHWASCEELKRFRPQVDVDPDPIFVRDGNLATSAGVTAGMDLALALVEEDLRPARGADRRALSRPLRPAPRRTGAVQLAPHRADRRPPAAARAAVVDVRPPRRRPLGPGPRRARAHEPAQLRPRVPRRDRA